MTATHWIILMSAVLFALKFLRRLNRHFGILRKLPCRVGWHRYRRWYDYTGTIRCVYYCVGCRKTKVNEDEDLTDAEKNHKKACLGITDSSSRVSSPLLRDSSISPLLAEE